MKSKSRGLIPLIIIILILLGIMGLYYYLLVDEIMIVRISDRFGIKFSAFVYSKKTQYVIYTLLYLGIYALICKIGNKKWDSVKSIVFRVLLALVMSVIFALQIFISDTLFNYRAYDRWLGKFSYLTLREFAFSDIWRSSISDYGFYIILINVLFAFTLIILASLIKQAALDGYHSYKEAISEIDELLDEDEDEDEDENEDENEDSRTGKGKWLSEGMTKMLDYKEEGDASVVRIIELYMNKAISNITVNDYIDSLPIDSVGLKNLIVIEQSIATDDPIVRAHVNKAKNTKFRTLLKEDEEIDRLLAEMKEYSEKDEDKLDNIVKVDFSKKE